MQVSQRLQQTLDSLGINPEDPSLETQAKDQAKKLLAIFTEIAFWENDKETQAPTKIPNLKTQFHAGVLALLELQRTTKIQAFRQSMIALNEFNRGNGLGATLANLIRDAAKKEIKGTEDGTTETRADNRRFQYDELTNIYSDYLSTVGLELIQHDGNITIFGRASSISDNKTFQEFISKVKSIIDPDCDFYPGSDKETELKEFVEDLIARNQDLPALKRDQSIQEKLLEYFFTTYSDQKSDSTTKYSNGSLTIVPQTLSINIQDGAKLLAFLQTLEQQSVEKKDLELIRDCILKTFRDALAPNISEATQTKRMSGLLSGIRQFQPITDNLKRLGIDVSNVQNYIKYSSKGILKEFVIAQEAKLLLNVTNQPNDFYSATWHNDSTDETYSEKMEDLFVKLETIKSNPNAGELYHECIQVQVSNLNFAVSDIENHINGTETSRLCGSQNTELLTAKLSKAKDVLERLNGLQ